MTSDARDAMLSRIRQALKRPAPEPEWSGMAQREPLFELADESPAGLTQRFQIEFAALAGEWLAADSLAEAASLLADWLFQNEIRSVLAIDDPLLRAVLAGIDQVRWVPSHESKNDWDAIDLGVTTALALLAESGSILISAQLSGRAPSVLMPIHLVVATADQIVRDLEASIALVRARYPDRLPSSLSWISGPSRTADIEKILVLGAHGPRRLVVLLLPAVLAKRVG